MEPSYDRGSTLYRQEMSNQPPSSGRLWTYRFSRPDGVEIETRTFNADTMAEAWARELSKSNKQAIVIHRHSQHVDAWEYVDEVDERP